MWRETAFRQETVQLLGLMTKGRWEKGQEKEGKMCEGGVRETPAVIDTQGESGRWLASLISCPKSVYGLEQTQHTWCARDSQTASNGHKEGWRLIFSRRKQTMNSSPIKQSAAVLPHLSPVTASLNVL